MRGPWLADRSTTVWLIAAAVSAWLVQLDRGRQGAERAVMRMLLSATVFIASTGAMALLSAAFVSAPGDAGSPLAGWFGAVPAGALVVLVALLRSGKGAVADARSVTSVPANPAAAWLIRAGLVFLAGAAIGSAFTRGQTTTLGDSEILRVKDPLGHQWSLRSQGVSTLRRENFASVTVTVIPERDGLRLPMVSAEARSYLLIDDSDAAPPVLVSGRHSGLFMDTRISMIDPDSRRPTIGVTFVPLGTWLVPGALLVCAGLVMLTLPPRSAPA
jgi:hypothetical protein